MMGKGHAVSGAAAWIALTSTAPIATGWHPLPALSVTIGAFVTAGAALLPDLDHRNGTAANSGGTFTKFVAGTAGNLSGGHRHGLHTALAAALCTALTVLAGRSVAVLPALGEVPVGSALILLVLLTFATKALGLGPGGTAAIWSTGLVATLFILAYAKDEVLWLPTAVLVGYLTHLIGDLVTTDGLPLLWPLPITPPRAVRHIPGLNRIWLPGGNVAVPLLGNAGSIRERALTWLLTVYVVAGLFLAVGEIVTGGVAA